MDNPMLGFVGLLGAVNPVQAGDLNFPLFVANSQVRHGQRAVLELLNLPHDYLEMLVLYHVPQSSLGALRASCRQLKVIADRRLTQVTVPYDSILRHSFWRTSALPAVTTLVLEMPGRVAAVGAGAVSTVGTAAGFNGVGAGPDTGVLGSAAAAAAGPPHQVLLPPLKPQLQPQGLVWQQFQPVPLLHTTPVVAPLPPPQAVAAALAAVATAQPLSSLLPPVTFAGLRRHLPGLRHLKLRNVFFPSRDAVVGGSNSVSTAITAAAASSSSAAADYPLDFSDILSLSVEGLGMRSGAMWRMQPANPFPSGLEPSLARAASSLTSLSLSHMTFEGNSGDVLRCLTALVDLSIRSCNNFTSNGLTVLGQLTRLTSLAYVDVFYKTGIPNEMVVLSALTRLRSANFNRCDLYTEEVAAWSTWGPSLTRLEMSSKWQMTLSAVPVLLPYLTSLEDLDLADHCLDRRMWRTVSTRMPRLTSARFSWVNLPDRDESDDEGVEDGEGVEEDGEQGGEDGGPGGWQYGGRRVNGSEDDDGSADAAGAGGPWRPPLGGDLRPIEGLRRLCLDGPWEGDECNRSILPLLPHLEELRIGDDPAALLAIAEDDPGVFDRLERWMATSNMLAQHDGTVAGASADGGGGGDGGNGGAVAIATAGDSLRVLSVPTAWLQHLLGASFPNLTTLRAHTVRPGGGGGAPGGIVAAATANPAVLLAEAQLRACWREPLGGAAAWAQLIELDVPRDLDAAALAPPCGGIRHLRLSQSYGDGLLALLGFAGPSRPLPRLQEVTLAGTLWSGMDPESYHSGLLLALAARGVKRVRATRGSCLMTDTWWARSRERLRRTLEAGQLTWPEVVPLEQGAPNRRGS